MSYQTERAARLKAAGLCVKCGKEPIAAGSKSKGEACLSKDREQTSKRADLYRAPRRIGPDLNRTEDRGE